MITVQADRTVCIGSGNCVLTAADTFDQDDQDGLVTLIGADAGPDADQQAVAVPADQETSVGEAVDRCPTGALRLLAGEDG